MKDPRKYIGGPLIEAVRRCHHGDHDEVAHDCWKVADCYGEAPWLKWSELVEFADAILLANEKWTEVLAARAKAARAEACLICGAHHPPTEDHGGYVKPKASDAKLDRDWINANRDEYRGKWVALHNGELVEAADTLDDLLTRVDAPQGLPFFITAIY